MKVSVTKENVVITETSRINQGEYRVNKCCFQLPDCFEGLTVTAAFDNIPVPLFGNECYIPSLKKGTSTLGVYAYKETEDGLQLMYSPKPTRFYVDDGSYSEDTGKEEAPEISLFEKYCEEISSLAIPKSNIINEFDIENDMPADHVFSANAIGGMANAFAMEIQNDRDEIVTLSEKYDEFSRQVDERVLNVETKEIVHESIKGNKTSKGTLLLSDVSPVKHNMEITLSGSNYSDINVTVRGKNLFGLEGRSVEPLSDSSNLTSRNFTGNGIYVGVTGNNYFNPAKVNYEYDSQNDKINVDCLTAWYGVGVDIPVKPGEVYTVSMESENANAKVVFGFYTSGGKYISILQGNNMKFTVPDNAGWMLCILASSQIANGVNFKNVQLEKGSVATEFCKYVHPRTLTADSSGNIAGVESIYPMTIIEADNSDIEISAEYNRDVNVAFNELRDAIIALGGVL